MSAAPNGTYIEEGVDALILLTPLLERRRQIFLGVFLITAAVGGVAIATPRKYKAEVALTPVVSYRSSPALGGIAALAGATLNTGYQLTPARIVELLKSRAVLAGVGFSRIESDSGGRVVDRVMGETYKLNDSEDVAKRLGKLMTISANKETGTISVAVAHRDSSLARIVASRVVDSASRIFVRISRAQAQQLRLAQEGRVANAASQLAAAENRLREFNFGNRATPSFSVAGLERERLGREIRFAEQSFIQAITERDAAFARELEATPTVIVQDPLPPELPKVRKRVLVKSVIAAVASFVSISLLILIAELIRRRLQRRDVESDRFHEAVATLPRLRGKVRL
ncbi:MAG: hypothetical protein ABIR58_08400 [Gemmatimonadaceae bacterium]